MTVSRKNISEPVLFFSILSALSIFLFKDSITLFPSFIHAWTQSDRYALALGFLRNGFDFFHPQTFNLFTAHGITQVDFPIHEYLVACLMKISGTTAPVVFRLYTLLYGLTGLFFLFKLTRSNGGSFFRGLFVSVFMMTCPVFTYYLDGFLPSIPSFSNVIIGYYFFFRYKKEQRPADFALAILFLALAALARMPFFIFLFAVFCQQVLESLHLKKINRHEAIVFLIGFGIWFAYLFYNLHLASQYGSQFLLTILPAKNFHEFKEILKDIRDNWKLEYFSWLQYLALLTLIFFIFVRSWKKISSQHKPMTLQILISGTGVLIYFLCMSTQFPEHDYYVIDSLYPVIALILVHAIQNIPANSRFSKIALPATGTVLLCVFVMSSSGIMKKRYTFHEWDRTEITRQNFTGTEQFLDSIGIPKTAKMLVLDAYTTNMPLILMNRMGYALLWTTKENIDTMMKKDFDYVVMQNCFLVSDIIHNDPGIITQLEKIADNGTISIYRKKINSSRSLNDFLGLENNFIFYQCSDDFETENPCRHPDLTKRTSENKYEGGYSLLVNRDEEYSPSFTFMNTEIPFRQSTKIFIKSQVMTESPEKNIDIVASITHGDENYYYRSFSLRDYLGRKDGWNEIMFQFVLPQLKGNNDKLSVYFWNKEKQTFYLDDFELVLYR